jgi:hypothetical protein
LYTSPTEEDEMGGSCATHGKDDGYKILVGKPEGKRPLGGPRRRWKVIWIIGK